LSRDGISSLTDTFSIFEENVKKLQISLDTASADSEASSATITRLTDGLRDACVQWSTQVEQRSIAFAKHAGDELEEGSRMVGRAPGRETTELMGTDRRCCQIYDGTR
jgi:hypothetical protein